MTLLSSDIAKRMAGTYIIDFVISNLRTQILIYYVSQFIETFFLRTHAAPAEEYFLVGMRRRIYQTRQSAYHTKSVATGGSQLGRRQ